NVTPLVFVPAPLVVGRRLCVRAVSTAEMRGLGRSRRSRRAESATAAALPRTCYRGFVSSVARRSPTRAALRDRAARRLRLGESSPLGRGQPAKLHRDVGSSSCSSTSCSTARERSRPRASLSAASIKSATTARTSREISGFHLLSFVFSFSAMASTAAFYLNAAEEATGNTELQP